MALWMSELGETRARSGESNRICSIRMAATSGRTDRWTDGRMDGQTYGQDSVCFKHLMALLTSILSPSSSSILTARSSSQRQLSICQSVSQSVCQSFSFPCWSNRSIHLLLKPSFSFSFSSSSYCFFLSLSFSFFLSFLFLFLFFSCCWCTPARHGFRVSIYIFFARLIHFFTLFFLFFYVFMY